MADRTSKILLLVEGAKTDALLMQHLFRVYNFDAKYRIVSYCTNIYTLYQEMFVKNDPAEIDLLQLLKSREPDPMQKAIFDESYSDILLIFDLDPQDPGFTPEKITDMARYFTESSDMGKLYLNYPMVESFYHMRAIPDPAYNHYYATLDELRAGTYKARVNSENRNHNYRKFAVTKEECNIVIAQNILKSSRLTDTEETASEIPAQIDILEAQLSVLQRDAQVAALSTCGFFIPEYNPIFIK